MSIVDTLLKHIVRIAVRLPAIRAAAPLELLDHKPQWPATVVDVLLEFLIIRLQLPYTSAAPAVKQDFLDDFLSLLRRTLYDDLHLEQPPFFDMDPRSSGRE